MTSYKTLLTGLAMLFSTAIFAQDHPGKPDDKQIRQRIDALRVSYLTEKMDLTPQEAQKFWPVYNQYRDELEKILGDHEFGKRHDEPDLDAMTDEQVEKMLEDEMARHRNIMELREKYYKEFKKVLPIKKVALLYQAEGSFQRELIRKMHDHDHSRDGDSNYRKH